MIPRILVLAILTTMGCSDSSSTTNDGGGSAAESSVGQDAVQPGDDAQQVTPDGTTPGEDGTVTQDDTHACLTTYTGPLVTVTGTIIADTTSDSGYYFSSSDLSDNTRFDARTALFKLGPPGDSMAEGVSFNLHNATSDDNSVCIAGGRYQGTYDRTISWEQGHHGDGMLAYIGSPDTTIDGVRADNIAQDSPTYSGNAHNFVITNSWFSYVRDDCIENDSRFSGKIIDNLYDGCYTFLSHQAESSRSGANDTVIVQENLIYMQNMPKPYDYQDYGNDPNSMGFGELFKQATGDDKPTVDVIGNVFRIEPNETPRPSLCNQDFEVELGQCRDNLLIWTGSDEWPDPTWSDLPSGCITQVVRGQQGITLWNAIKQNWINCHPKVAPLPGDPVANPSACKPNAYGGGQGGTQLPNA